MYSEIDDISCKRHIYRTLSLNLIITHHDFVCLESQITML